MLFNSRVFKRILRRLQGKNNDVEIKRRELLLQRIFKHVENNSGTYIQYKDEIEYLKSTGIITPFPYPSEGLDTKNVIGEFDEVKKLPYVMHKGKRLYFHNGLKLKSAKKKYLKLINVENILGDFNYKKSPHKYITNDFYVKTGDVLMDIGAAEGLFLLDNIEKIKKGYIIEASAVWMDALNATFEPYLDKVEIINKYATNTVSATETTIDECLKGEMDDIFIKIDVEGYEIPVLSGAEKTLNSPKDIKVACCTYHRKDDAQVIDNFFADLNYNREFSDGYMLFFHDKSIDPPYFRRGMIRARKFL